MIAFIPINYMCLQSQEFKIDPDVLAEISSKWDSESARTFNIFISEFYCNIKNKHSILITKQVKKPIYIIDKKRTIKLKTNKEIIEYFNNSFKNDMWNDYLKNPNDLNLFPQGIAWDRGRLWFNAILVNGKVIWKLEKITIIE